MQTNLIFKKRLPLRLFLKKSTPAPLVFSKFVKTPAGVHSGSCTPLVSVYLMTLITMAWS